MSEKADYRFMVVQFTTPELRQRMRYSRGLALLTDAEARRWRMMAYGILRERRAFRGEDPNARVVRPIPRTTRSGDARRFR